MQNRSYFYLFEIKTRERVIISLDAAKMKEPSEDDEVGLEAWQDEGGEAHA